MTTKLSKTATNWADLLDRLNRIDRVLEAVQIEYKAIQSETAALARSTLAELDRSGLLAEGREEEAETILRGSTKEGGAQ